MALGRLSAFGFAAWVKVSVEKQKTKIRLEELESYMTKNVLGAGFVCPHYRECKSSHSQTFYEGQLHHVGTHYDLSLDMAPMRVAIVGQEYGHKPSRVTGEDRYKMIMESALDLRFKAGGGFDARNPHMKGTTNVLRLLFGIPLGIDHDSEFLMIDGKPVHIFDAFALVNYLLCSAVLDGGSTKGKATRTMKENCSGHFRAVMQILAPSVLIVQGTNFWSTVRQTFDSITRETDNVYKAAVGEVELYVAAFHHPSAHFPHNWGVNDHTPYLLETVVPAIETIHSRLARAV